MFYVVWDRSCPRRQWQYLTASAYLSPSLDIKGALFNGESVFLSHPPTIKQLLRIMGGQRAYKLHLSSRFAERLIKCSRYAHTLIQHQNLQQLRPQAKLRAHPQLLIPPPIEIRRHNRAQDRFPGRCSWEWCAMGGRMPRGTVLMSCGRG